MLRFYAVLLVAGSLFAASVLYLSAHGRRSQAAVQARDRGDDDGSLTGDSSVPVEAGPKWFDKRRTVNCAAVALFVSAFFFFYVRARRGAHVELRHISGIEAFDAAVSRAAEMGRPILYVPGLQSIGNPATIASMAILSKVADKAARLAAPIRVPSYDPLTWPVARSVVEEAYVRAGRREAFDPQSVMYLSARHLAYATAVAAMMVRDKTEAHFFVGHFYSESLILAETGAATGAKQIAASDSETQLPFLIATCDHTLIGEELFAAAAIFDESPVQKVTIRVHDWFKALAIVAMLLGLILAAASSLGFEGASFWLEKMRSFLTENSG